MPDPSSSQLVVPPDLESAGSYINGVAGTIASQLETLKSQLAPIQEIWQGPASSYYQGLQQEWNVAAEGLFGQNGVLGQVAQTMNLNWNNYSDCEWANVKTWQH